MAGLAALWMAFAVTAAMAAPTAAGEGAGDAARGRAFFTSLHGREWSCASCHGENPGRDGRHAGTGKRIAPMAPAANPERFTDAAKTQKWFRRNCNDVLGRGCTPAEQADVIAWLRTVTP